MARKAKARMSDQESGQLVKEGGTFLEDVKVYLGVTNVKRLFGLGSELFGAMSPFLEKPTWWNAAKSVFSMGKVLVEDVEVWADDYFSSEEWVQPYNNDFNQTMLQVLQRFPYERIKTAEENTYVRVCTLPNGIKCGWTHKGRLMQVERIYVDASRVDEARATIKRLLWEQYSGKSLVMRKNSRMRLANDEDSVSFEIDDSFESRTSRRAIEYAEYLKKPLATGTPRSIMFYGPPGTGKSTLARTIVEMMGLRSFRIRIGDLGSLDNSTLFEAISLFEPDAIILDDFDRAHGQAALLETLEFFEEKIKLVLITVNNRQNLDDALRRPGRIDEVVLVDRMDEDVVRHVLGEYVDGFDLVKEWPIAFVNEYVIRRRYLNKEETERSIMELTQRIEEMDHYKDDEQEDVARMSRLYNRKRRKKSTPVSHTNSPEVDEEAEEKADPSTDNR